jgi:hypothetical protein
MTLPLNKTNSRWITSIVILVIINILLFWPPGLYFLNDDLLHIPLTDKGYFFQTNSIRPVHELLVRLELWLWGKNAYGYHITALLLHFILCFQLFQLCIVIQTRWLDIEKQQAITAAFLSVVLFLTYPQHSESLAWILGRAPILSGILSLIVVRLFFAERITLSHQLIAAFCFGIALLTYEQPVLLPLALLITVFLANDNDKGSRNSKLLYVGILMVVSIAYVIMRSVFSHEVIGAYEGSKFLSMNVTGLAANLFRILSRLLLNPAATALFFLSVIILLLLVIISVLSFRNQVHVSRRGLVFFTSILLLLIAPVLSLGVSVHSFESGRYLYIPSAFLMMAISIAGVQVYSFNKGYRIALIMLSTLVISYWLLGKYLASGDYKDASAYAHQSEEKVLAHFKSSSDTLFIDTLRTSVHHLPVFRLGFKAGAKWLDSNVDTGKILVRHFYDENEKPRINN